MRQVLSILMVFAIGCGSTAPVVVQYSGVPERQHVEKKELPEPPDAKPIPAEEDWVKPLPAGKAYDKDGVLISPAKAARAKQWQLGYKSLRDLYEIDRQIWEQQRIVYDERLGQANKEIERLSPSWWSDNKGTVGLVTGIVLGVATTIGIVYAVDEVKQ